MRLSGKRAFVTGGRQGIGRAIVEAFLHEGASVITCGRGDRPDLPDGCGWHTLDVADAAQVEALARAITMRACRSRRPWPIARMPTGIW